MKQDKEDRNKKCEKQTKRNKQKQKGKKKKKKKKSKKARQPKPIFSVTGRVFVIDRSLSSLKKKPSDYPRLELRSF